MFMTSLTRDVFTILAHSDAVCPYPHTYDIIRRWNLPREYLLLLSLKFVIPSFSIVLQGLLDLFGDSRHMSIHI